jgi:hypothetical protein
MKQIQQYPNYSVTKEGKVFSHNIIGFLAPFNCNGYLRVSLSSNNKFKKYLIHRLVAESFIENMENKPFVNHINGNKSDNRLENLEWCNNSENMIHAYKTGLYDKSENKAGEMGKKTIKFAQKANEKLVLDTQMGIFYNSAKEASDLLGINYWNIVQYLRGRRKNRTNLIYA